MFIGVDLGGTKIEVVVLNAESKQLYRYRLPTPQGDYSATLVTIQQLINLTIDYCPPNTPVGICIPGAISPSSGLVKNANSTCLIGKQLNKDLENLIQRPVRVANDADCFALSEAVDGAGKEANSVFGVILGTGVGGGIVINGSLLQGPNAICGEWGHNPLPWIKETDLPLGQCYCGKQGCIETFISGPAFSQRFSASNEKLTAESIWKNAQQGDQNAQRHCEQLLDQAARALSSIINILDPEVIVLGGGLSNIDALYGEIPKRWQKYVFSDEVTTQLKKAKHGDSSGVRGAAWLWH